MNHIAYTHSGDELRIEYEYTHPHMGYMMAHGNMVNMTYWLNGEKITRDEAQGWLNSRDACHS